jgi:TPR repeat protein
MFSVPISDFAIAHEELADVDTDLYYECCGKCICKGCLYSFHEAGNDNKCPFCNSDRAGKTLEENNEDLMKRVEANDAGAMCLLGYHYHHGRVGLQQNHTKAMDLYAKAADLGCSKAHNNLGNIYDLGGDLKKAKFHYEAAAMAGHEMARYNLGNLEAESGNINRAVKHWIIAASAGCYNAMHNLLVALK